MTDLERFITDRLQAVYEECLRRNTPYGILGHAEYVARVQAAERVTRQQRRHAARQAQKR